MNKELADQVPQVTLAEDDELIQAFGPNRFHEALRMWIAVWTLRRDRDALHAAGLQERRPRLGEHRVPIVDEVARVAQESVHGSSRLRVVCFIQSPSGATRIPATCTSRVFTCMTKKTM
jgi:hypothetical protein